MIWRVFLCGSTVRWERQLVVLLRATVRRRVAAAALPAVCAAVAVNASIPSRPQLTGPAMFLCVVYTASRDITPWLPCRFFVVIFNRRSIGVEMPSHFTVYCKSRTCGGAHRTTETTRRFIIYHQLCKSFDDWEMTVEKSCAVKLHTRFHIHQ